MRKDWRANCFEIGDKVLLLYGIKKWLTISYTILLVLLESDEPAKKNNKNKPECSTVKKSNPLNLEEIEPWTSFPKENVAAQDNNQKTLNNKLINIWW